MSLQHENAGEESQKDRRGNIHVGELILVGLSTLCIHKAACEERPGALIVLQGYNEKYRVCKGTLSAHREGVISFVTSTTSSTAPLTSLSCSALANMRGLHASTPRKNPTLARARQATTLSSE